MKLHTITVVTNASGDGTGYSSGNANGRIAAVRYVKAGSGNYDNGVDFVITGETTGVAILTGTDVNASATSAPMQATHSVANAAALYAGGGTAVNAPIPIANERIKVVVAQGGDTKTGVFYVWVGD